jgi:Na+/H+-dicarboxylate symporter
MASTRPTRIECGWPRGDNLHLLLTVIGMAVAIVVGACVHVLCVFTEFTAGVCVSLLVDATPKLSPRVVYSIKMPGQLFMNALKLIVIPLMFVFSNDIMCFFRMTSMISAMVNLDPKSAGKIGCVQLLALLWIYCSVYSMVIYLVTTLVAVITGIVLVVTIQPGGAHGTLLLLPPVHASI